MDSNLFTFKMNVHPVQTKLLFLSILFSTALLISCSQPPKKSYGLQEELITEIKEDGTKLFEYRLSISIPHSSPKASKEKEPLSLHYEKSGKGNKEGGKKAGNSKTLQKTQIVYQKLNTKLKQTGYCRKGYIELNNRFDHDKIMIRGECEEGATETDREKFPNTVRL